MSTMRENSIRNLLGKTGWDNLNGSNEVEVNSAKIRGNGEFVLDCLQGGLHWTVHLTPTTGNELRGEFTTKEEGSYRGSISARLFTYKDELFLFGTWKQDNYDYHWWAHLYEVEPDEG